MCETCCEAGVTDLAVTQIGPLKEMDWGMNLKKALLFDFQ